MPKRKPMTDTLEEVRIGLEKYVVWPDRGLKNIRKIGGIICLYCSSVSKVTQNSGVNYFAFMIGRKPALCPPSRKSVI